MFSRTGKHVLQLANRHAGLLGTTNALGIQERKNTLSFSFFCLHAGAAFPARKYFEPVRAAGVALHVVGGPLIPVNQHVVALLDLPKKINIPGLLIIRMVTLRQYSEDPLDSFRIRIGAQLEQFVVILLRLGKVGITRAAIPGDLLER